MIPLLKSLIGCFTGLTSEEISVLSIPRSNKWKKIRNEFIKNNNKCAVCGSADNLVAHHIVPVHVDPSKELDFSNLIPLCQNPTFNCHLFFGHFKNWCRFNPNVSEDAKNWKEKMERIDR